MGRGLCKPTIEIWQGDTFLLYESIEGTLYNEDGTEYKPLPKVIPKPITPPTPKEVKSPEPKNVQQSMLDMFNFDVPERKEEAEAEID